jgi:hypothetical protein
MAHAWEPEATDVHFSQYPEEKKATSIWDHYGMKESLAEPVIFGYGMRKSLRPQLGKSGCVWRGGPGTWYAWSTLLQWERWPRRQKAHRHAVAAEPEKLLLFISHRWESLDHPDPTGAQLLCLKVGLTLALAAAVLQLGAAQGKKQTASGLPELIAEFLESIPATAEINTLLQWAEAIKSAAERLETEEDFWRAARRLETENHRASLDRIRSLVLIWYDYASMFQAPRSPAEEAEFRREILQLNAIQRHAGTLVIAGDHRYLSRAWCFLELCGGMRQRIVELTPSWGTAVQVGDSVTHWASRSDQLIGGLNAFGQETIRHSGLEATHPEDLTDIARLLGELPLAALIETDDSDLIGGAIPLPFRSGQWLLPKGGGRLSPTREQVLPSTPDFGRLPAPETIGRISEKQRNVDALRGGVGIWVYTTQRMLTLAWFARAYELWTTLKNELLFGLSSEDIKKTVLSDKEPDIACMWADSRSLADDGGGWTRAIPSGVDALFIVTQADLPNLCRIYDWVVTAHLACKIPVITYTPEIGRTLFHLPQNDNSLHAEARKLDVLAVPRMRRQDVRASRIFTVAGTARRDVEVLAALRLDPSQGLVRPGRLSDEAAADGLGTAGEEITAEQLLVHSETRVRAEGFARSTAATWHEWCTPRLHQAAWQVGMAPLQVRIIEQLVRKVFAVSDNPLKRRKLLKILVEDHAGYALPLSILEDADEIINMILKDERPSAS